MAGVLGFFSILVITVLLAAAAQEYRYFRALLQESISSQPIGCNAGFSP